ncbi:MAG TPA: carboxypeptidase-like regulatory domain-containing protein [Tepidisphaeraceae bacterium]|nr:carboxypeptidase-like regulatory domain-containing protein [Tepidisphaeraceae bacterium]
MVKQMRWLVPATAAVALLIGFSAVSTRAADEKKGTVNGTVVDKDGKGVADVEVRLMKPMMRRGGGGGGGGGDHKPAPQASDGVRGQAVPLDDAPTPPAEGKRPGPPKPIATATTDADGKFEMKDVPVGDFMVGVRDPDKKVFGMTRVSVKDGETATVEIKTSDTPPARRGPRGGGQGGEPK